MKMIGNIIGAIVTLPFKMAWGILRFFTSVLAAPINIMTADAVVGHVKTRYKD
jgi:hypothetical protein